MRKVFGVFCIVLGICCLLGAIGLIVYNRMEEENARNVSQTILQDVRGNMEESTSQELIAPDSPTDETAELPREMLTSKVEGYDCIGVLSIPVLELELPVLTDWSYEKLKAAPCRYFGSYFEENFVIAAHNYQSHFGRLSELLPKDLILFTDVSGNVYCYEVVLIETLPGTATEEMLTSGFDLSLYTCTPGGASRVTVRCKAVSGA